MLSKVEKPLPDQNLSQSVNLMNLFVMPQAEQKPDDFSQDSWNVIVDAVQLVHKLEIQHLDELVTDYVTAIVRAQGCGCAQCKKRARILTDKLDDELMRQTQFFESETEYEDHILAERAISIGMQRMHEKRLKAWDQRAARLRQLIKRYMKGKDEHLTDPLSKKERQEVKQLLIEARKRAQDNKRKRGKQ